MPGICCVLFSTLFGYISHEVPQDKYKNAMTSFQKEKDLLKSKGNPLAVTLGTSILLTLCNFVIAEDKLIFIKQNLWRMFFSFKQCITCYRYVLEKSATLF